MAEIRIIHRGEDLAALQPQWWQLWRRAAAPPFVSPAWLIPWWQIFRPGELRSVAVLDGGRLIALAALYRDRGRLLPVGIALSDYLDVLAEPADPAACRLWSAACVSCLTGRSARSRSCRRRRPRSPCRHPKAAAMEIGRAHV